MRSAIAAFSRRGRRPSSKASRGCGGVRGRATCLWSWAPATSTVPRSSCMDENASLARYTTIGTGGPARWFARPESVDELQQLLAWAREEDVAVETVGLG